MSSYALFLRNETSTTAADLPFRGISGLHLSGAKPSEARLIAIEGIGAAARLIDGDVYTCCGRFDQKICDFSMFQCLRHLSQTGESQRYLVELGLDANQKMQIMTTWAEGGEINWSELDESYGGAWIDACQGISVDANWVQPVSGSGPVHLASRRLRDVADFYCSVGEQLFGSRGYAGSCLHAMAEVLNINAVKHEFVFSDKEEFRRFFLAQEDYSEGYFEALIATLNEVGCAAKFA